MENEIDLTDAELYADAVRGVYIPQFFAESVKRDMVKGVSDWCWQQIEAGPRNDFYWDAWNQLLSDATLNHPKLGQCWLYQDGDLWVVPFKPLAETV